jgi:hypothetical protein
MNFVEVELRRPRQAIAVVLAEDLVAEAGQVLLISEDGVSVVSRDEYDELYQPRNQAQRLSKPVISAQPAPKKTPKKNRRGVRPITIGNVTMSQRATATLLTLYRYNPQVKAEFVVRNAMAGGDQSLLSSIPENLQRLERFKLLEVLGDYQGGIPVAGLNSLIRLTEAGIEFIRAVITGDYLK